MFQNQFDESPNVSQYASGHQQQATNNNQNYHQGSLKQSQIGHKPTFGKIGIQASFAYGGEADISGYENSFNINNESREPE